MSGWKTTWASATDPPTDIYKPGKLFRPDSGSEGSCIDAEPITGNLPSIEAQGSKGFVVDVGTNAGPIGGSVGAQATSFKLKSTTDVEQAVIEVRPFAPR